MGCQNSKDQSSGSKAPTSGSASGAGAGQRSPFSFHYTLLKDDKSKLGEGQFAVVRKAIDNKTGDHVAVKCIDISRLTAEDEDALKVEVEVMKALSHDHLVKFIDFYEDSDYYFLVMEMMSGGELFTRIVEREKYSEADAQVCVKTLTEAIQYCHSHNVVHRDLKPENILLANPSPDAPLKIADFGFAKFDHGHARQLGTACGTPGYVAPEILEGGKYGKEVDIWSLGVIFYILLCGYPPFHDPNQAKLFEKIKAGEYDMDEEDWGAISPEAKDLVNKMLVVDPRHRYTCEQILAHTWITGRASDENMPGTIGQLKMFNAKRKLKATMSAVRAGVRVRMMLASLGNAAATLEAERKAEAETAAHPTPTTNPMAGDSAL